MLRCLTPKSSSLRPFSVCLRCSVATLSTSTSLSVNSNNASKDSNRAKRFLQTDQRSVNNDPFFPNPTTQSSPNSTSTTSSENSFKWASHSLPRAPKRTARSFGARLPTQSTPKPQPNQTTSSPSSTISLTDPSVPTSNSSTPAPTLAPEPSISTSPAPIPNNTTSKKPRRKLRPRKAVISLTPSAISHLRALQSSPSPQMIRIGVRNRGCSGLSYYLDYVSKPGPYDEEVIQDDVKVLVDSKALFSVIGSEMDWVQDKLASKFVFRNPNSKGQCGCGESFMV